MLNRTHGRMAKWEEREQQVEVKKERKKFPVNISFTCNPSKQWRWRTTHCLISSAVVVFPIHALICTSHLPLAQFSRNRKWSTSHCSPCGTLLTTALSSNQHYKDIITNNICVTDGDQLPMLKRNVDIGNREHLWSNIVVMRQPLSERDEWVGGWLNAVRERRIDWQYDLKFRQFMDLALMEKLDFFFFFISHSEVYHTDRCF